MTRSIKKSIVVAAAALVALVAAIASTFTVSADEHAHHAPAASAPHGRFDADTVKVFSYLPVQDGGRVKPLSTYANFTLLALNGYQHCTTPAGDRLSPTEWLMNCLFFPEEAVHYPCFVVVDSAVLDALGLEHEGKSRKDRYSYFDLEPGRAKLYELASQYDHIDEKERNPVQGQVINLAHNFMQFETIAGLLGPMGRAPAAADSPGLSKVFGTSAQPGIADVLEHAGELKPFLMGGDDPHAGMGAGASDAPLRGWIEEVVGDSRGLALIPPAAASAVGAEWLTPADVVTQTLLRGASLPPQIAALRELDAMSAARGDDLAFRAHAQSFSTQVVALADGRGEYSKIPLEVAFYRADFFYYSLIVFVLAFLAVAVSWAWPAKIVTRGATGAVGVALLLLTAGIVMRCVIRGRPPVSTLYESVLFVTAVGVIASLVAEYVNRRGIALAVSAVLGAGGMFIANRYEVQEHVDTMPSLVAVLDTNFWLASHVTTVTIGYGAGLLAGALGHVYVLGKLFGLKKNDAGFYKSLSSMTYGMLCFGLLFSVVGTVLGGIWANESWGRFWGWDPKENGALTIVLWELIILHARMGGYLRDFGVAMASVFGAVVVASSWWGVNLLGVGLHAYGFTSGILWALLGFYAVEAGVLGLGGVYYGFLRGAASSAPSVATAPPVPPRAGAAHGGVR